MADCKDRYSVNKNKQNNQHTKRNKKKQRQYTKKNDGNEYIQNICVVVHLYMKVQRLLPDTYMNRIKRSDG